MSNFISTSTQELIINLDLVTSIFRNKPLEREKHKIFFYHAAVSDELGADYSIWEFDNKSDADNIMSFIRGVHTQRI